MSEKETKEGGVTSEDVLGTLAATAEALKSMEGVLPGKKGTWGDSWEARDKAREERETKEYTSVQDHRKEIERQNEQSHLEHKRANDLHEAWNKASEVERAELKSYRGSMLAEAQKQTAAFQNIAEALNDLGKK